MAENVAELLVLKSSFLNCCNPLPTQPINSVWTTTYISCKSTHYIDARSNWLKFFAHVPKICACCMLNVYKTCFPGLQNLYFLSISRKGRKLANSVEFPQEWTNSIKAKTWSTCWIKCMYFYISWLCWISRSVENVWLILKFISVCVISIYFVIRFYNKWTKILY